MKNTSVNPKIVLLILLPVLFSASFVLIGCGLFDDNIQPEIETITNQLLYVGEETQVELNITDEDTIPSPIYPGVS